MSTSRTHRSEESEDFEHLPPEQLADDILKKEQRIAELMAEIKQVLNTARL